MVLHVPDAAKLYSRVRRLFGRRSDQRRIPSPGSAMRLLTLLLLPSLTFAAPVPKSLKAPAIELALSAESASVLEVTVRNNGRDPLELPYRVTPLEQLDIDLCGEKGERY